MAKLEDLKVGSRLKLSAVVEVLEVDWKDSRFPVDVTWAGAPERSRETFWVPAQVIEEAEIIVPPLKRGDRVTLGDNDEAILLNVTLTTGYVSWDSAPHAVHAHPIAELRKVVVDA